MRCKEQFECRILVLDNGDKIRDGFKNGSRTDVQIDFVSECETGIMTDAQKSFDVVVLEGTREGIDRLKALWQRNPSVLAVLVSEDPARCATLAEAILGETDRLLVVKTPCSQAEVRFLVGMLAGRVKAEQRDEQMAQDHSFLDELLETSPDAIYFKDLESRFLRINKAMVARMHARELTDVLGKTDFDFFTEEHARGAYEDEQRIMQSGESIIGKEEKETWRDGSVTWVSTTKMPRFNHERKVIGIVGISRDVTARHRAEESLRLLESAVHQANESIVITNAQLTQPGPVILFVNAAYTRLTGYSAEEALGRTPRMLQGLKSDRKVLNRLKEQLAKGECFEGEIINYRKDGSEFDLEWQVTPIRNNDGEVTHFVSIQRDLTERNRMIGQLVQSQKLETVGKLAGGIAHEFNSILTAIIGRGELLLGELATGGSQSKAVMEILEAAERAAGLTRQMLAYGRKQMLQPERLDLGRLILNMSGMILHFMGENVQVKILALEGEGWIKADAGQIEQVVMNLVMNARDAMPKGGDLLVEVAKVCVEEELIAGVEKIPGGDYMRILIRDTGWGMEDALKARAFEPFFTTKDVGEASGFGLATCYGIIKQSGGYIGLESEVGKGTSIRIYLPILVEETIEKPAMIENGQEMGGTERILIWEGDSTFRFLMEKQLSRMGYQVELAENGKGVLEWIERRRSEAVCLAILDENQLESVIGKDQDRFTDHFPGVVILLLTGTKNVGAKVSSVEVLQKPFSPSSLTGKVRQVLDLRKAMLQEKR